MFETQRDNNTFPSLGSTETNENNGATSKDGKHLLPIMIVLSLQHICRELRFQTNL